ncbi:hypothetical protein [Roseivirga sp.]
MDNQNKIPAAVKNFIIGGDTSNIELLNATLHEDNTNVQNGFLEREEFM